MRETREEQRKSCGRKRKKIVFGCLHDVYNEYACKVVLRVCIEVQLLEDAKEKRVQSSVLLFDVTTYRISLSTSYFFNHLFVQVTTTKMFRQVSRSLWKQSSKVRSAPLNGLASQTSQTARFGTAEKSGSVMDAWKKSCYFEMDYKISENSCVYEAVEKFAGYDVGALIAVDSEGE